MKFVPFKGRPLAVLAVLLAISGCGGGGGSEGGGQSAGPTSMSPTPIPPIPPAPPTPHDPSPPPDAEPDAFTFSELTEVTPNALVTFNSIEVAGVNVPVSIAITNGEYAIDDGPFNTSSGVVMAGQRVTVRARASGAFSTAMAGALTIGAVSSDFRVTTAAEDLAPDAFSFDSRVNAAPRATVVSNTVTISGINSSPLVRIEGGSYQIDGGAFTTAPQSIRNGQSLRVLVTASAAAGLLARATISVGSVSANFNVTTAGTAEFDAPLAEVLFPPRNAATSGATVSVVGTAVDAQEITSVKVNGVAATSSDGFATWRAVVPLVPGSNVLRVSTADIAGNTNDAAVQQDFLRHEPQQPPPIGMGPPFAGVGGLLLDPATRRFYGISNDNIVTIDAVSGDRGILSPATGREGLGFGAGLSLDVTRQRLLLVDSTAEAINTSTPFPIIAVSTVGDGARTVFASANTGSGEDLRVPLDIAVDSANQIAYVITANSLNRQFSRILRIDLVTGERSVFSDAFSDPVQLMLDGDRLVVTQGLTSQSDALPTGLYSLTLADQRVTPISTNRDLVLLTASALDKENNRILYLVGLFEIFGVLDLATNSTRVFTRAASNDSPAVGTGEAIRPSGIVIDPSGKFVYTFSADAQGRGGLYAVELLSGDRVLVSR